jgi:hypothetical protein
VAPESKDYDFSFHAFWFDWFIKVNITINIFPVQSCRKDFANLTRDPAPSGFSSPSGLTQKNPTFAGFEVWVEVSLVYEDRSGEHVSQWHGISFAFDQPLALLGKEVAILLEVGVIKVV